MDTNDAWDVGSLFASALDSRAGNASSDTSSEFTCRASKGALSYPHRQPPYHGLQDFSKHAASVGPRHSSRIVPDAAAFMLANTTLFPPSVLLSLPPSFSPSLPPSVSPLLSLSLRVCLLLSHYQRPCTLLPRRFRLPSRHTAPTSQISTAVSSKSMVRPFKKDSVLSSNLTYLLVSLIADAEAEEGDFEDDEDINELRLQALHPIFDMNLPDFVSTPREILTRWEELCAMYDLDGTGTSGKPSQEEVALREEWQSLVEKNLKKSCLEEVREIITFPEEFRTLAKSVNDLTGPGLTELKSRHQASIVVGRYAPPYAEQSAAEMVKTPEWLTKHIEGGWDCAAGWDMGSGFRHAFYAVYCRRSAAQLDEAGPQEAWAWRYFSSDPMNFGVFDTIPEFLAWYSRYREPTVPDASSMTGYDILMGRVF